MFLRYTGSGAVGTAAHYAVLMTLVSVFHAAPTLGTALGFIVGAGINYAFNYRFTFRSDRRHREAMPRFLALALLGFCLNVGIVSVGTGLFHFHYLIPQVAATALVLVTTFVGNRIWTFKGRAHG
jgi:putative flippase GtrA